MASITVKLKKSKVLKDGTVPIILQILMNRKKREIFIGHSVKAEHWDDKKREPNRKHPNSVRLRSLINKVLIDANDILMELQKKSNTYTLDDLVSEIKVLLKGKTTGKLLEYYDQVKNHIKAHGSEGNYKVYVNGYNVLSTFLKKDLAFEDFTYKKLSNYADYLATTRGCKPNTVSLHIRTLRAVFNRAIKEGIIDSSIYPFRKFKMPKQSTIHRALSIEEIKAIKDIDLKQSEEIFARDLFMFSFYCMGMNFVDIIHLKKGNIKHSKNDNTYQLVYTRQKTKGIFKIKLPEQAVVIMNKYKTKSDFVFPVLQGDENDFLKYKNKIRLVNKKLKIIGEKAKVSIPLTTYVARHSWATIAKRKNISTSIISEALGHKTEEITQVYLDSFENKVIDDANDLISSL